MVAHLNAPATQRHWAPVIRAFEKALGKDRVVRRKEELLVEKDKLSKMWVLRRILMQMGTVDAMEFLLDKMKDSKTNEDFFDTMNQ